MAKQVVGELFAAPHLRKYIIRNLDPRFARTTQHGLSIQQRISEKLQLRVQMHPDVLSAPDQGRGRLRLVLAGPETLETPQFLHQDILEEIEALFYQELHSNVRQLFPFLHKKRACVEVFLKEYHITEEDLSMDSVLRMYHRYVRKHLPREQRMLNRGRPRKEPHERAPRHKKRPPRS